METKHTKGEWKTSECFNFSGTLVCYIESEGESIAQTRGQTTGQEQECEANAQLMATSPKLLKNLIRLIDRMEENDLGHMNAVIEAIKVVEEATGMKYERTPNFK